MTLARRNWRRLIIVINPRADPAESGSGPPWVCSFSGLAVERRAGAPGGPDSFAFPAGLRIVDAAVHPFGEEAQRIGHAQDHELPVHQRDQRIGGVAGDDGRVLAQAQRVELIHPVVIMRVGAAGILHVLEVRARASDKASSLRDNAGRSRSARSADLCTCGGRSWPDARCRARPRRRRCGRYPSRAARNPDTGAFGLFHGTS